VTGSDGKLENREIVLDTDATAADLQKLFSAKKWSPSTAKKPAWKISSSRSPGEGWHKMNWQTIPPLIQKDLMIFFRNRFYSFITVVALVAYIGVYYADARPGG
jgi:hypothetical protein